MRLTMMIAVVTLLTLIAPARAATALEGSWKADRYYLKNGSEYPAAGQILFTGNQFSVVYLVLKDGKPQRGSGEAGDYSVDGEKVVFTHRYLVTTPAEAIPGLEQQQLHHAERSASDPTTIERATFKIEGERLTLFFPSGNRLTWTRLAK
jgi:hypothetical protein